MGFESLSGNPPPSAVFQHHAACAARPETDTKPILSEWTAQNRRSGVDRGDPIDAWIWRVLAATICVLIIGLLIAPRPAHAAPTWGHTTATWYGPGFYGNGFACRDQRPDLVPRAYRERTTRGVAHMTLPCGARVTICRRGRCVRVRVIDRGAFHSGNFDLTARTARDLCRCWAPYTMRVRWTRGWPRG